MAQQESTVDTKSWARLGRHLLLLSLGWTVGFSLTAGIFWFVTQMGPEGAHFLIYLAKVELLKLLIFYAVSLALIRRAKNDRVASGIVVCMGIVLGISFPVFLLIKALINYLVAPLLEHETFQLEFVQYAAGSLAFLLSLAIQTAVTLSIWYLRRNVPKRTISTT